MHCLTFLMKRFSAKSQPGMVPWTLKILLQIYDKRGGHLIRFVQDIFFIHEEKNGIRNFKIRGGRLLFSYIE